MTSSCDVHSTAARVEPAVVRATSSFILVIYVIGQSIILPLYAPMIFNNTYYDGLVQDCSAKDSSAKAVVTTVLH